MTFDVARVVSRARPFVILHAVSGIVVERAEPGVEVVVVTGEHDLSTAPELERRLDAALDSGHAVVVDLLGNDVHRFDRAARPDLRARAGRRALASGSAARSARAPATASAACSS